MRLVYLSPVPWESFPQRPHKFAEWFHKRTNEPVVWLDPYPTRFPGWGDFQRLRSPSSQPRTPTPDWLILLKPNALPIEPIPGSGWVNGILWQKHTRTISDFAKGGKTLLAIGKPSVFALKLLHFLRDCPSLYDAMDDFPNFYSGLSRIAFMQRESSVAASVDTILASSSALKARWDKAHKDVRLVRNALDLSAIRAAKFALLPPSGKKVFGYVGTIASWFDWEWVCALAEFRPESEIHLIGLSSNPPARTLPPNIHLFPACAHQDALKAMTTFHAGLIPFKKNELTASVDPIKYYEYRALGLPVISTDFGEMSLRTAERGVFLSRSVSDISAIADAALQFSDNAADMNTFSTHNTWEHRFDAANILQ